MEKKNKKKKNCQAGNKYMQIISYKVISLIYEELLNIKK